MSTYPVYEESTPEARRKSEERFRLAAAAGKMFAHEWDAAAGVVMLCGECSGVLGLDEGAYKAGPVFSNVHADDRERVTASLNALTPANPFAQISYRIVHPDRGELWVETTCSAVFDEANRLLRISGMTADITRRELAEMELAKANDRLHLAMDAGKSVGWEWDVKSGRDCWFGALQTMFGIPSDIYVGHVADFRRRVYPEDRELVWKAVKDAMQNRELYVAEFRCVRADGNVRWVAAQGKFHYSPDGEPERMLGIAVDITERKGAEEALRESEHRLRLAAEAGRMYAYEWDPATDVIVRSAEFAHILGWTSEARWTSEAKNTCEQMLTTVHPDDRPRVIAATEACTPLNPKCQVRYRVLRPDGSVVWLEKNAHAFFDNNGKMVRMIGMVVDITDRKLAEEALSSLGRRLIEAQETERARIARDLHDDIGQRLALLSVTLEQLKGAVPDPNEKIRGCMDSLRKQIMDVAAGVHNISQELHPARLRHLDIATALRGFCTELSEQQKVKIDFSCENIPAGVTQEISLCLFRVLQEGLHNAVKHSRVRHFEVELCGRSKAIHLTIRDSGCGFDPETALKGRGLGLTSMQERLKLVNGELSIDSQLQRGAVIHARIPFSTDAASSTAAEIL